MRLNREQKTHRAALLIAQDHACAMCGEHQDTVVGMIYAPEQNAMICRNCSQFKAVYTSNIRRGCTVEELEAFLARPPAPEPLCRMQVLAIRTGRKLTPAQERARQACADGQVFKADGTRMSVEEWDELYGTV